MFVCWRCQLESAGRMLVLLRAIMLMAVDVGTMGGKPTFAAPANSNGQSEERGRSGPRQITFRGASAAKVGSEPS
jgi:hypothetical protein